MSFTVSIMITDVINTALPNVHLHSDFDITVEQMESLLITMADQLARKRKKPSHVMRIDFIEST